MRNCTVPLRNSTADYDLCLRHSIGPKKAGLRARRQDVLDQYALFTAQGGRAHNVPRTSNWPANQANWQRALYDETYEGKRLADMRGGAFEVAAGQCLLCSVTQPGTLDHFLPREHYPALSALNLNLIAACDECNRTKGRIANTDPSRQFVHPYLDPLPVDVPFLHCAPFAGTVLSPEFSIGGWPEADDNLLARMRWQFGELELNALYQNQAVFWFEESREGWRELAEEDVPSLATALARDLRSVERPFGCNRWKPALIRGLLEHAGFLANPLTYLGN